jgi:CBS domain-containing protein
MKNVAELMKGKTARPVVQVRPGDTVLEAIKVLATEDVGAAVVLAEDGRLAGIFSERDYTRKIVLHGRSSESTRVDEIMTANVVCVTPRTKLRDCMALMTEKGIRHLPIIEEGRIVGMVSIRDIVSDIIADQDFTISQLESYISGQ